MEEELEEDKSVGGAELNPDALEAALGDDYVEIDEEIEILTYNEEDEDSVDIAFSQDDPRDWY